MINKLITTNLSNRTSKPSRSVIDNLWITDRASPYIRSVQLDPPKIIKNRLNFALSEKLIKPVKITIFTRFLVKNDLFPVYRVLFPVYPNLKKSQKTLMRYQGFLTIFSPKSQYMGLQNPKNRDFCLPPKIIKNRLNFAHSEKFMKICDFVEI